MVHVLEPSGVVQVVRRSSSSRFGSSRSAGRDRSLELVGDRARAVVLGRARACWVVARAWRSGARARGRQLAARGPRASIRGPSSADRGPSAGARARRSAREMTYKRQRGPKKMAGCLKARAYARFHTVIAMQNSFVPRGTSCPRPLEKGPRLINLSTRAKICAKFLPMDPA